jgi:hypothetical protein
MTANDMSRILAMYSLVLSSVDLQSFHRASE